MATIKAFIRTSKKNVESNIRIRLRAGREVDLYAITPKTILADKWNEKNQECKSSVFYKSDSERNIFNKDIADLKAAILKSLETVEAPNTLWLETEIDKYYNPEKFAPIEVKPHTLFSFITQFIQDAPNRVSKKTGSLIAPKAVIQYQISFDYLKAFADHKKKKDFEFSEMNKDFYNQYIKFLQSKKLASNTIGAKVKHLKLWLNEAPSVGIYDKVDIQKSFKVFKESSYNVALDEVEIQKLFDLDFSTTTSDAVTKYTQLLKNDKKMTTYKIETLDAVRDSFLLECWTGCRYSDIDKITKENIQATGLLKYTQQKTGSEVFVPLHHITKAILEKYNYTPPKPVSNQRFNDIIKIVCRIADIGKSDKGEVIKEIKEITIGGKKQVSYLEKWEMVSSHTGRRSMATNCFRMGMPTITLMAITGHSNPNSLLKYIKVGKEEHAKIMADHWNKIYNTKK